MIGRIGFPEIIFIFLVVMLLFGAKALPEIAKGLAQAMKIFKKEIRDIKESVELDEVEQAQKASLDSSDIIKDTSNDFDPEKERRDWRPKKEEVKEVS